MEESSLYCDGLYPKVLSKSLNEMRCSGILCDIVLVCDGEICAHKIVLAASSPYFRGMFSLGLKESNQEKLDINWTEGIVLRQVVDFMYTGEIDISEEHIFPLLEASTLLQLGSLRVACLQKLFQLIGPYSTFEACGRVANKLGFFELEAFAHRHTIEMFQEIAFGPQNMLWLRAPYEVIRPLFLHPAMRSQSPSLIVKAVIDWVLYDECEARDVYIEDLLSHISWIDSCCIEKETKDLICSKSEHFKTFFSTMSPDEIYDTESRKESQVVLAIGGFSQEKASKTVECYLVTSSLSPSWTLHLPEIRVWSECGNSTYGVMHRAIPTMKYARAFAASASSEYEVYLIGGEREELPTSDEATFECYNIASNTWSARASIPLKQEVTNTNEFLNKGSYRLRLVGSAAALVEGNIFVCGGHVERVNLAEKESVCCPSKWTPVTGLSKATWVYNKEKNRWRKCNDMIRARAYHGAASVNGVLYALGGIGADGSPLSFPVCLSSMERYDPWDGIWRKVNPMPSVRAYFGCVAAMQYIYVMGGHNLDSCKDTVFRYDSISDTWSCVDHQLFSPIDSLAAGALRNPVTTGKSASFHAYLIGGRNSCKGLQNFILYNFDTHRWHYLQSMISERVGGAVAVARLPNRFGSADKVVAVNVLINSLL